MLGGVQKLVREPKERAPNLARKWPVTTSKERQGPNES